MSEEKVFEHLRRCPYSDICKQLDSIPVTTLEGATNFVNILYKGGWDVDSLFKADTTISPDSLRHDYKEWWRNNGDRIKRIEADYIKNI